MLEAIDMYRLILFLYLNLRHQYLVDTFHRRKAFRNIVSGLRELLQRVDNRVEHHEIIDELRTRNHGVVAQDERSAEPQHNDYHHRSEKFAHRMGQLLAYVHTHDVVAVGCVHAVEARVHLLLGAECLDDTQSAERLLHLTHRVAPQSLRLDGVGFQPSSHNAHEPTEHGYEDYRKQGELPRHHKQRREVGYYEDRILEKHIQRRHYRVLNLLHVAAHTGNDVALAFLGEEAERQRCNLLIELVADVAHHSSAYRDDGCRGKEVGTGLQEGHEREEQTNHQQCVCGSNGVYEFLNVVVGVIAQHLFRMVPAPRHQLHARRLPVGLEENLQYRDYGHERKDVQYGRQYVEDNRPHKVLLVWRNKTF